MNATQILDKIEANWHIVKGEIKKNWGKLTDNDLVEIDGSREKLMGIIMKKYAISMEKAKQQIENFSENAFKEV